MSDQSLLNQFKKLVEAKGTTENKLQTFLEEHTEFLPLVHEQNHGLHFKSVITKFEVGPYAADFAYLAGSSDVWRLVLVELERPGKRLFKQSSSYSGFTAEFNDAVAQIDTWRALLEEDPADVKRRLAPLVGSARRAWEYWYVLVIGRDEELAQDERRRLRLAALQREKNLRVMTWDSLVRHAEKGHERPKCVLSEVAAGYRVKRLGAAPAGIFGVLGPGQLKIGAKHVAALKEQDYDMDAWLKGEKLLVNHKHPFSRADEVLARR